MSNVTTIPVEIVDKTTGHITIMHFVTEERIGETREVRWSREPSNENIEAELVKSGQMLDAISWRRITTDDLPKNRLFRDCWRSDGRRIAVDMGLAREAHLADVRRARDAKLREKDGDWLREFSRGNAEATATVEAERQTLRDVPQTIDAEVKAARTPEALKAIWPDQLGAPR